MESPLARALLKVGAVLLFFTLLGYGGWYAVVKMTDERLLDQLRNVPGLTEVSQDADAVVVRVASDLSPAAAQQTVDRVMHIAKNQQVYRTQPVELVQGAFTATMLASAPGVPPGKFRGDVANLLNAMGGVESGVLRGGGQVEVELSPDHHLPDWAVQAGELLELNDLVTTLQVSNGVTEFVFGAGRERHRLLLWDAYQTITGAGASIESLRLRHDEAGPRLSGELTAPDRAVAAALVAQLTELLGEPSAADALELQIADDVRLVGLGDAAGTLGFVDLLRDDGLQVPMARTDRSRIEVVAANPRALDTLLAKMADPGWALSADSALQVSSSESAYGGLLARNDNLETRVRSYQQLWSAGFPDVFVASGDAPKGAVLGFLINEPDLNDYTDAETQAELIGVLRKLDWQGRASFQLSPDPQASTLSFISTADGEASDIIKPRATGGRWWDRASWGQDFIDQWNATATD